MAEEERKLALYCLKANSDYHSEVCEECVNYSNCDHMIQDDVTETIIKELEKEPILDKIRAEIMDYEEDIFHSTKDYSDYAAVRHCVDIIDRYIKEGKE